MTGSLTAVTPPLGLYIHIPWCVKKCPYCDFNSHVSQLGLPEAAYVKTLLADMQAEAPAVAGREVRSVFFGGGTPSLFSAGAIGDILDAAAEHFSLANNVEITLESNPGTAEAGRFAGYRAAGVNRLSMGVQSLNDLHLRALGRIHSAAEAVAAFEMARRAGFENINLDLMYGLPDQSLANAVAETRALCELQPEHVSHYQLTLEPETPFYHRPPELPADEVLWDMQLACQQSLADRGYGQYEVSAYAQPGKQCAHNLNYWRFGDYVGIGAGAHGKISRELDIERRAKPKIPGRYMNEGGLDEQRTLDAGDRLFEFAVNALRLREGFSRDEFVAATGLSEKHLVAPLAAGIKRSLLEEQGGTIRATETGYRYLNDVILLFDDEALSA